MTETLQQHARGIRNVWLVTVVVAGNIVAPAAAQSQSTGISTRPPLVDVAWLAAHIKDSNLVLLHLGEPPEYINGHIPGAQYPDLRQLVTSEPPKEGKDFELPPASELRAALETMGISDNSNIVVYFGKNWLSPATRVMFTLTHVGLGARTFLLDGGMPQWVAKGHTLTKEVPTVAPGKLSARETVPLVATLADVKASLGKPGVVLIDARDTAAYNSRAGDAMMRAGHIPGAVNMPFTTVFDASLFVKSDADLRAMFTKAGAKPGDSVIVYCHIGQQATTVVMAARMLGYNVRLYDGSYHEWSFHTDLPIEISKGGGGGDELL